MVDLERQQLGMQYKAEEAQKAYSVANITSRSFWLH